MRNSRILNIKRSLNFYVFVADAEIGHAKVEELQHQQNLSDDLAAESVPSTGVVKINTNEDDSKTSYSSDIPVCLMLIYLYIFVLLCTINMDFRCLGKFWKAREHRRFLLLLCPKCPLK